MITYLPACTFKKLPVLSEGMGLKPNILELLRPQAANCKADNDLHRFKYLTKKTFDDLLAVITSVRTRRR